MGQVKNGFRIPCVWEGIEYPSIAEASRQTGIAYPILLRSLKQGRLPAKRSIPCEWNGVQYPSIRAAADANWITPVGMWFRIRKNGYTSDEDMNHRRGRS